MGVSGVFGRGRKREQKRRRRERGGREVRRRRREGKGRGRGGREYRGRRDNGQETYLAMTSLHPSPRTCVRATEPSGLTRYSSVGSKPLCFPSKEDSTAGRADFQVMEGMEGAILAGGRELVRHEEREGEGCTCFGVDKRRPVRNDLVTVERDVRDCVGEWDSVLS